LRKVLRPASGESLLTKSRAGGITIFSLPGQERLWVDADAFWGFTEQATQADRTGQDSLPFWEAAHALVTGEFLEDDLYSSWVASRRQTINAARHRCLHRLADLYVERNMPDQAETLLQLFLLDEPTDEDALCRLMLLLEEQGRYQEAYHLYEHTARILDEEFHTTAMPRTRALAQRLSSASMTSLQATLPAPARQPGMTETWKHTPYEREALNDSSPFSTRYALFMLKTLDMTASRRQVLQGMLSIASAALALPPQELLGPDSWERLALVGRKPASIDASVMQDLETITKSYWRLRANTTSTDLMNGILGHFQTVIEMLQHSQPTATFRRLCSIAGETAQILGQMLFDQQDYPAAWSYYTVALHAAQEALNTDLWAVGLGRMSFLLTYSHQAQEALPLLQEAQHLAGQSTLSTMRSWLAAVEAEAQAHLPDATACSRVLDTAELLATEDGFGVDPYATGLNLSRLAGYKGVCYVRLQQPDRALPALQQAVDLLPPSAIRRQSTLLTDMATAYVQQGAIEQACKLAGQAATLTVETRSRSILQRLRHLRRKLEPWNTMSTVRDFDEQTAVLLASLNA
jgi:tetratricopeptide (TPR) repeat protein